jgi:SHS2 domain-containing protein
VKFKFLKHTADIKFQAFGKTIEEVFGNSASALKESICGKKRIKIKKIRKIKVRGKDTESLMYKFLEEIIYLLEGENFIIGKVKNIKIEEDNLVADVLGDDVSNYKISNKVKAVTYNEMVIENKKKNWIAQIVLDV